MIDVETKAEIEAIIATQKAIHDAREFDYVQDDLGNLSPVGRDDSAWDRCCRTDHWFEQFTGEQSTCNDSVNLTFVDVLGDELQEFIDHVAADILQDPHLRDAADDIHEKVETYVWDIFKQPALHAN